LQRAPLRHGSSLGGKQSARFAELCTVARKALPHSSREIRILRERSTEGKE